MRDHRIRLLAVAVIVAAFLATPTAAGRQTPPPAPTFRSALDLVVVNVVVRDRDGQLVRGLTRDDFTVTEDNRPQTISTFDFEEIETAVRAEPPSAPLPAVLQPAPGSTPTRTAASLRPPVDVQGRRLLVLFFDLSSMEPEDVDRAVRSAQAYIESRMSAADAIAVASLSTSLRIDQDFTADRDALRRTLAGLNPLGGGGFESTAATDAEDAADTGNAFQADDSEFTIFNTDRRIDALRIVTDALGVIEQKKSILYFSSGMTDNGLDNRAALGSLINRAVRANVSLYTVDARGLEAVVAGGEARNASVRGTGAFSGRTMSAARDELSGSQDTLVELAERTGGRSFLDQNDLGGAFDQVVKDTSAYYLIGYASTNPARDGRYRRIRITLTRPDLKPEYRNGYYAPRDFAHSRQADREQQLQEQLQADLPPTDLPVHGEASFFRVRDGRYHVPLGLILPGSFVPFVRSGNTERATLDILGVVRDTQDKAVAWIRDTARFNLPVTETSQRRNVQYDTSFELPPGRYKLRVVLRENQNGALGSLDTTLVVPALEGAPLKVSSIVMGNWRTAQTRKSSPLVRDGRELVPNVAHIVRSGQAFDVYLEVYQPAGAATATREPNARAAAERVRILSGLACYRGTRRVYQTEVAASDALTVRDRQAVGISITVPPGALAPGLYTCQANVVDDIAGRFAFPRFPLYVSGSSPAGPSR